MPVERPVGIRLADFGLPQKRLHDREDTSQEGKKSLRRNKGINPGAPSDPGLDNTGLTYRFKATPHGKVEEWFKMLDRPLTADEIGKIQKFHFGENENGLMLILARAMICGDCGRHMTVQDVASTIREAGRFKGKSDWSIAAVVERTISRMNLALSKGDLPFVVSYEGYVRGKPNAIPRDERQYRFFVIEPIKK